MSPGEFLVLWARQKKSRRLRDQTSSMCLESRHSFFTASMSNWGRREVSSLRNWQTNAINKRSSKRKLAQLSWAHDRLPGNSRTTWMDFWSIESQVYCTMVLKMEVTVQKNPVININATLSSQMHTFSSNLELHLANRSDLHLIRTLYYPHQLSLPLHQGRPWDSEEVCFSTWLSTISPNTPRSQISLMVSPPPVPCAGR